MALEVQLVLEGDRIGDFVEECVTRCGAGGAVDYGYI